MQVEIKQKIDELREYFNIKDNPIEDLSYIEDKHKEKRKSVGICGKCNKLSNEYYCAVCEIICCVRCSFNIIKCIFTGEKWKYSTKVIARLCYDCNNKIGLIKRSKGVNKNE